MLEIPPGCVKDSDTLSGHRGSEIRVGRSWPRCQMPRNRPGRGLRGAMPHESAEGSDGTGRNGPSMCVLHIIGPACARKGSDDPWRDWVTGSSTTPDQHLVVVASPRALQSDAKVVNGPAWYPTARVEPLTRVTINGWRMHAVFVPPATNDGSAFARHVVLIWTLGHLPTPSASTRSRASVRHSSSMRSWRLHQPRPAVTRHKDGTDLFASLGAAGARARRSRRVRLPLSRPTPYMRLRLVGAGADAKLVRAVAGQASPVITLKRYSHLLDSRIGEAADRVDPARIP
jgi:hypothetical protein